MRFQTTQLIEPVAIMSRSTSTMNVYVEPNRVILSGETPYGRATYWVPAQTEKEWSFSVQSSHFAEVLVNLATAGHVIEISMASSCDKITIRAGSSKSTTKVNAAEREFIPPATLPTSVKVGGKDDNDPLRKALSEATIFASHGDFRPILNCVCLRMGNDKTVVYGADGYRAFRYEQPASVPADWELLIPRNVLILALRQGKPFFITTDFKEHVVFTVEDMVMETSTVYGKFPDIDYIIPKAPRAEIHILGDEAYTRVKQAMVFAVDHYSTVRLTIDDENYHVEGVSAERGDTTSFSSHDGHATAFDVSINGTYLMDFLRLHERLTLKYDPQSPKSSPLLFETQPGIQILVMPVRD